MIIAEAVICSHFEQIRRLSPKSGDLTCMIYANGIMCKADWNSDGVVVKYLLAEQEARDSIPNLTTTISEIGYLLLSSHNLAEISPKRRKSSEQQTMLEYNRQI